MPITLICGNCNYRVSVSEQAHSVRCPQCRTPLNVNTPYSRTRPKRSGPRKAVSPVPFLLIGGAIIALGAIFAVALALNNSSGPGTPDPTAVGPTPAASYSSTPATPVTPVSTSQGTAIAITPKQVETGGPEAPWRVDPDLVEPQPLERGFNVKISPKEAPEKSTYRVIPALQHGSFVIVSPKLESSVRVPDTLEIFNTKNGQRVGTINSNANLSNPVLGPDGQLLAAWVRSPDRTDNSIAIFDAQTGVEYSKLELNRSQAESQAKIIGFSQKGIAVQVFGGLRIFDRVGSPIATIHVNAPEVMRASALSPSGRFAVLLINENLRLSDVETGSALGQVPLPAELRATDCKSLSFSSNGSKIAGVFGKAADGKNLRFAVWDAANGKLLTNAAIPTAFIVNGNDGLRPDRTLWSNAGDLLLIQPSMVFHIPDGKYMGSPKLRISRSITTPLALRDDGNVLLVYEDPPARTVGPAARHDIYLSVERITLEMEERL